MAKFQMHEKVKDVITGFSGLVTGRTEWDNGCVRYAVQPPKTSKDGKPMAAEWFDEQNLLSLAAAPSRPTKSAGGPPIHGDPTR